MLCISLINQKTYRQDLLKHNFFEIRLDALNLNKNDIKEIFALSEKNFIATFREKENISLQERKKTLILAIESGAKYIDIEEESPLEYKNELIEIAQNHQCKVIISYHNFSLTPLDLEQVIKNCQKTYYDYIKIACMVNSREDNARLLALYQKKMNLIVLGMGNLGKITRIANLYLGSPFTFVSVDEKSTSAPGQFDLLKMQNIINLIEK